MDCFCPCITQCTRPVEYSNVNISDFIKFSFAFIGEKSFFRKQRGEQPSCVEQISGFQLKVESISGLNVRREAQERSDQHDSQLSSEITNSRLCQVSFGVRFQKHSSLIVPVEHQFLAIPQTVHVKLKLNCCQAHNRKGGVKRIVTTMTNLRFVIFSNSVRFLYHNPCVNKFVHVNVCRTDN